MVGIVEVHDDIDARETGLGVFSNNCESTTDFFLFIFNDVKEVHRDHSVNLNKDGLTDAGSVQIERVVSSDVEEEILRADLKPIWSRGSQREVTVGPRNGAPALTGFLS